MARKANKSFGNENSAEMNSSPKANKPVVSSTANSPAPNKVLGARQTHEKNTENNTSLNTSLNTSNCKPKPQRNKSKESRSDKENKPQNEKTPTNMVKISNFFQSKTAKAAFDGVQVIE